MQDIGQFALAVNVNLKQSAFAQQATKWAGMPMRRHRRKQKLADGAPGDATTPQTALGCQRAP